MDFFAAQDNARRNTVYLVILMILAILALIAVTTLAVAIAVHFMSADQAGARSDVATQGVLSALSVELVASVAFGILVVVILGGVFKQHQLRGGGKVVAEALGGREINVNTRDRDERRILNVVEEMAIAAGTTVPSVYVLEEDGINAFAAGHRPSHAVIGITRGAIRNLTREELQGVVAHEFSHILHGDMRLNMRLISVLHGILLIGLIGGTLLHSVRYRRRGGGKRDNSSAIIPLLGAALMLIGYVGTFFGKLIKSAVSRQREYLADASAVQFTRNPQGIGNALIKIGSHAEGAHLNASQAPEFSHMFFGQSVSSGFNRMMATHPPLKERIHRVMPDWSGSFQVTSSIAPSEPDPTEVEDKAPTAHTLRRVTKLAAVMNAASAQTAMSAMGRPDQRHLAQAQATLEAIPKQIRNAAHEPYAARALMYALLLSPNPTVRERQLAALKGVALPDVYRELEAHMAHILSLDEQLRLPLVELALPALRSLSVEQVQHFRLCMERLINADGQVSLFEWTLYQLLLNNLGHQDDGPTNKKLADVQREAHLLLSVLAAAGQDDPAEISAALSAAERELPIVLNVSFTEDDVHNMQALSLAVERLRRLQPMQKAVLMQAMARCIEHSGQILPAEAELFRAIADMLGCPVPPLLADEPLEETNLH